jgi:hypothetical protein
MRMAPLCAGLPLLIPLVAAAPPPKAAPAGCADRIAFDLDPRSFASNGAGGTFPAARLAAFRTRAARAFTAAADELCARRALPAGKVAALRRVVIQSASGASETTLYRAREFGPASLVFQYAFVEADLAVPDKSDIQLGLRCWADPRRKECEDMGD